jgi:hypothetical protein
VGERSAVSEITPSVILPTGEELFLHATRRRRSKQFEPSTGAIRPGITCLLGESTGGVLVLQLGKSWIALVLHKPRGISANCKKTLDNT